MDNNKEDNKEDNKFNFIKQKLEEDTSSQPMTILKQRNFFWDNIILSVALFISGLSISGIIAELLSDENSIACFTEYTNRSQYTFINSYCHKDLPRARYFPLAILVQVTLLIAPHYGWKVLFSAKLESFLNHAAKVEILREKNTGKYPYHNYTIVKYLQREFGDSKSILACYFLKLVGQIAIIIFCFALNVYVFEDITKMDITFECKDDDQLFDNELFANVTCVYPRKDEINVLVGMDYFLLLFALLMLLIGGCWLLIGNHSQKDNRIIADFCYNSCIDPQYCYNLPGCNSKFGWLQMRNDFTLLLASLHSGYKRVVRTIIIEEKISQKFSEGNKLARYLTIYVIGHAKIRHIYTNKIWSY